MGCLALRRLKTRGILYIFRQSRVLSTNLDTCLCHTATETNHKIRLEFNFTSYLKCLSKGNNITTQKDICLLMTASFTYQVHGSPLKRPAKKMFAKCTNIAPTACLEVSKNLEKCKINHFSI